MPEVSNSALLTSENRDAIEAAAMTDDFGTQSVRVTSPFWKVTKL